MDSFCHFKPPVPQAPPFPPLITLRDHRKSEIFWELRCNRNSTLSLSLRSRGLFGQRVHNFIFIFSQALPPLNLFHKIRREFSLSSLKLLINASEILLNNLKVSGLKAKMHLYHLRPPEEISTGADHQDRQC